VTFIGGYAWYRTSGMATAVDTARQTKQYFDQALQSSKESMPPPNEAIQWLRQTAGTYSAFVPGAKQYVDKAFDDIEAVQKKHGPEVNKIVSEAYNEIKDLGLDKKGFSVEGATKVWGVLQKHLQNIGELAGDAAEDIMKNHPEMKEKFGGQWDQLNKMGDQYGPEAKKMADQTTGEVQDILKGGLGIGTADKLQKLIREKIEQLRQMGDKAWDSGMEQAKPLLEKSPELKQLFEGNFDKLKQNANVGELFNKVQNAASTGDTKDLEQYVKSAVDKAQQEGGSLIEKAGKSTKS